MKGKPANIRILFFLLVCAILMIGVAYASVPLYRLFCSATGYNGTTQRVSLSPGLAGSSSIPSGHEVTKPIPQDRSITITFDSNVDSKLPWDFTPDVKSVRVKLGEVTNISYHAHNKGNDTLVGTATFNVQPDKVGTYFDKIQCFCFTKQVLKPGQTIELPVQFFIDPALADDRQADDIQNITLSYTFFLAKDQSQAHETLTSPSQTSPPPIP